MSSVAKELSAATIANQISLERQAVEQSVVLVEGGTDARYFRQYIDDEHASITVCHDRERAVLTLHLLKQRGIEGVLAIIDRDYNDFLGEDEKIIDDDIIFTDENDLETSIIPTCIHKIINEYGTKDRVDAFTQEVGDPLEFLLRESSKIGALRLVQKQRKIAIRFEGMTYQFASAASVEISLSATIDHLVSRSNFAETKEEIEDLVNQALTEVSGEITLCQGHDVVRIFGRALRRAWGSCAEFDKNDPEKNDLYRILRVAHEREDFLSSAIFAGISAWESRNEPWKVLKS